MTKAFITTNLSTLPFSPQISGHNWQLEIENRQCLDAMHGIEQVFTLGIDVHSQFFALGTEPILEFGH